MRPIRVEDGVLGAAAAATDDVVDEVDGFLIVANEDGGRMPVGLGSRDDAVDISLLIDRSDGVGDGARSPPSDDVDGFGFVSLILMFCTRFSFVHLIFL